MSKNDLILIIIMNTLFSDLKMLKQLFAIIVVFSCLFYFYCFCFTKFYLTLSQPRWFLLIYSTLLTSLLSCPFHPFDISHIFSLIFLNRFAKSWIILSKQKVLLNKSSQEVITNLLCIMVFNRKSLENLQLIP